jgi:glycosyltransferase involved in cell wall biosynthesis
MERPFFSVIIPAYNRASILPETIESIQKQSFDSWEIIVVDDGSKDNTEEVVRGILSQDSRINYVYQENAERSAALDMIHRHSPGSTRRLTLGADKGYDAAGFVADLRKACVTPHVAQKSRHSAIDGRTTRHEGYAQSIKHRKRIEEAFGWAKTIGGMAQTVYRGVERVRSRFILTMAANNLARLPKLLAV